MDVLNLVFLIVGVVLGIGVGVLLVKVKRSQQLPQTDELKIQLKLELERSAKLADDLQRINQDLREEREKVLMLNNQNASLKANFTNLESRLAEQKDEFMHMQQRFAAEFKNLANDIFEEKSRKFTDQNKANISDLLKPLGEKLNSFEQKVEQSSKDSVARSSALREQIIALRELNQRMTQEAENLTKALKGDVKMQGNWGEVVLESILEKSGLEKGREYFTQETHYSDEGRRLRPDVIIKLPDSKNLVIDAKVSLIAYERYMNTEDEKERSNHLRDHLISIKAHIKGLSEKNYHQLFDGGNLDYVLMFIPIESAFSLIVQHGGELYNDAHEKSIIIVSPATLIATLRTVSSIWKHEYQNQNALEIARQGGALYDKFKAFVDDLMEVGRSLDKSKNQYSEAMNKLVSGKDNLIRKTERLRELGAKTNKQMEGNLLARAGVNEAEDFANQRKSGDSLDLT
jgi:DNA recombination protein RmuC